MTCVGVGTLVEKCAQGIDIAFFAGVDDSIIDREDEWAMVSGRHGVLT